MTSRYAATKLFEGDAPMMEELDLSEDTRHIIEEILTAMEREVGMERAAVMADTRYRFIEKLLSTCYTRATEEGGTLTDRLDRVLTHTLLAIPVFLLMMMLCSRPLSCPYRPEKPTVAFSLMDMTGTAARFWVTNVPFPCFFSR